MSAPNIETIVSLAKRRGFVFPSSEIYGGLGSAWDYGPMGVELCNNVKRAWWRWMVYDRDDMEGIDSSIIQNRLVWKYSGHEDTFSDPLVDCKECKSRFRADKLTEKVGEPVVYEEDVPSRKQRRRPLAAVEPVARLDGGAFARRRVLEDCCRDAGPTEDIVVEDAHAAARDRPHRELRMYWNAELADDEHVERRTERAGNGGGNRHSATRQREDDRPVEFGQLGGEPAPGVSPVTERRKARHAEALNGL